MEENKIKIAALQETKFTEKSKMANTADYTLVRKDRERNSGGGLAFLIHKTIQFQKAPDHPEDPHLESLGIVINNTTIFNIYIPPTSSCTLGYSPSLLPFLQHDDALILGDFNAHDALWYSQLNDTRGSLFADEISNSNFGVLNEDKPT